MDINHSVISQYSSIASAVNVDSVQAAGTLSAVQQADVQPLKAVEASSYVTLSSQSVANSSNLNSRPIEQSQLADELPSANQNVLTDDKSDDQLVIPDDVQVRNGRELSLEQVQLVEQLAARDRDVRAHEQAHANIGGSLAGAPSYDYSRGPDGRLYATAGEVSIDTSSVAGNPQATIEKMRVVISAASAPAEPSGADRQVAAKAAAILAEAVSELGRMEDNSAEKLDTKTPDENQEADNEEEVVVSQTPQEQSEKLAETKRAQIDSFFDMPFPPSVNLSSSLDGIITSQNSLNELLIKSGAYDRSFPAGSVIQSVV